MALDEVVEKELLNYYNSLIEDRVEKARRGKKYATQNQSTGIIAREKSILKTPHYSLYSSDHPSSPEEIEVRDRLFKGLLYDRLETLEQKGFDLKSIMSASQHPLLTVAILWYKAKRKNMTKERFIAEFDTLSVTPYRNPMIYVPSIALLEAMVQCPEKLSRVDETSPYLLHCLFFQKEKEPTIREINEEIGEVISNIVSDGTRNLSRRFMNFVRIGDSRVTEDCYLGKYSLPKQSRYKWDVTTNETDIDKLFGSSDVNREIYETLIHCVNVVGKIAFSHGKHPKKMRGMSEFVVSNTEYYWLMGGAEKFAINQLLGSFKKHEGKEVHQSYLSYRLGFRPGIENERLIITKSDERRIYTLDSKFLHSTKELPLTLCIINRYCESLISGRS